MAVRCLADVNAAYDDGRWHMQRFYKSTGTAGDGHWHDWSYAAGQPGYDARIGAVGEFNPYVATKNDAIWFPGIAESHERHLARITLCTVASGTGQLTLDGVLYDLLGVYPLIDGDSTDEQTFTNAAPLPRYADGVGVFPVLVNHVSPIVSAANLTYKFLDTEDVEQTVSAGVHLTGQNRVCSGITGTTAAGAISLPIASAHGCKAITSLTFTAAPGGLFAVYLVKPITTIQNCDGSSAAAKIATEKDVFCMDSMRLPRIYDGAWLGFFLRPNGSARTISSVFGNATFIWG